MEVNMNHLIIVAITGKESIKEFTIPVTHMKEGLRAADAAYCGAMAFLQEQRDKKAKFKATRNRNLAENRTPLGKTMS
jgi:hypothetical protein